jgi:hypothetical protein
VRLASRLRDQGLTALLQDLEFDAPVLGASLFGVALGNRALVAKTFDFEPLSVDAMRDEVTRDGGGTPLFADVLGPRSSGKLYVSLRMCGSVLTLQLSGLGLRAGRDRGVRIRVHVSGPLRRLCRTRVVSRRARRLWDEGR